MNYLGIDVSLTSTAVSLYNGKEYKFYSFLKNYDKPTKWTKMILDFVKIEGVFYDKSSIYTEQEYLKVSQYGELSQRIVSTIKKDLIGEQVVVGIETYSLNSSAGHLVDIVRLSTLIQDKLINQLGAEMTFYSPSTLKKNTCGLTYGYSEKNKTHNPMGIAGGNFKKHQMVEAIRDYNKETPLSKYVKRNHKEILELKKIPSPIDDLVDSAWCLECLLSDRINKIKNILNK